MLKLSKVEYIVLVVLMGLVAASFTVYLLLRILVANGLLIIIN